MRICEICGNWARTFDVPELIHHRNCPKHNPEYEEIIANMHRKKRKRKNEIDFDQVISYIKEAALNKYGNGMGMGFAILLSILELNEIWG